MVWTSSNEIVATVVADELDSSKVWITANAVGRAVITVTTEDGEFTDTCEITVGTKEVIDPNTKKGNFTGTLIDENGNPMVGYFITLCSTPVTVITDNEGKYTFTDVDFTNHTLIVENTDDDITFIENSKVVNGNSKTLYMWIVLPLIIVMLLAGFIVLRKRNLES